MQTGNLLSPLLSGATTGTSPAVAIGGYTAPAITITATAALSAGTLIVEESDDANYQGTWSQIEAIDLPSLFTASGKAVRHYDVANYTFLRVRVGTTVSGGTISVTAGAA